MPIFGLNHTNQLKRKPTASLFNRQPMQQPMQSSTMHPMPAQQPTNMPPARPMGLAQQQPMDAMMGSSPNEGVRANPINPVMGMGVNTGPTQPPMQQMMPQQQLMTGMNSPNTNLFNTTKKPPQRLF